MSPPHIPPKRRARTKPNATGRDGKRTRKGNPTRGPKECGVEHWGWFPAEMLGSTAFRSLSGNAFLVVFRVLLEHINQGGTSNGELVVTYAEFVEAGVTKNLVARAIHEAEAAGVLAVRRRGRIGEGRNAPSLYRLTWLGAWREDGEKIFHTNEWKARTADDVKRAVRGRKAGRAAEGGRSGAEVVPIRPKNRS